MKTAFISINNLHLDEHSPGFGLCVRILSILARRNPGVTVADNLVGIFAAEHVMRTMRMRVREGFPKKSSSSFGFYPNSYFFSGNLP